MWANWVRVTAPERGSSSSHPASHEHHFTSTAVQFLTALLGNNNQACHLLWLLCVQAISSITYLSSNCSSTSHPFAHPIIQSILRSWHKMWNYSPDFKFRISYSIIPMPWNMSFMMQIFLLMIDVQNSFIPIAWIVQIVSHEELSVIFAKKWNATNYKLFIRQDNLNKILWVPIVWSLIIAIDLPSWSIISSVPIIYVSEHGCCQLLKLDLPICSNNRLCDLKEGSSNGQ